MHLLVSRERYAFRRPPMRSLAVLADKSGLSVPILLSLPLIQRLRTVINLLFLRK